MFGLEDELYYKLEDSRLIIRLLSERVTELENETKRQKQQIKNYRFEYDHLKKSAKDQISSLRYEETRLVGVIVEMLEAARDKNLLRAEIIFEDHMKDSKLI